MPEYCTTCDRFLVREDGEDYLKHLDEHGAVQDAFAPLAYGVNSTDRLSIIRYRHSPGLGYCHYIVRGGNLYEYGADDLWRHKPRPDQSVVEPPLRHSEWL